MPKFTRLTKEQIENKKPPLTGERAKVRLKYQGYLKDLKVNEGGELALTGSEKKVTIKNRLKRAADDLGMSIKFKRSDARTVRFQVEKSA